VEPRHGLLESQPGLCPLLCRALVAPVWAVAPAVDVVGGGRIGRARPVKVNYEIHGNTIPPSTSTSFHASPFARLTRLKRCGARSPAAMRERPPRRASFPPGSVVLISGIMGAGKSAVAQALAERLPRAVHVRGDLFRRMIVTGRAEMVPDPDATAIDQLQLRYRLAGLVADGYADAGFTVVYQDIILASDLERVLGRIQTRPLFLVVLAPRLEVVRCRAETRHKPSGYGAWTVEVLDELLRRTPRIGLWLDTSDQTVDETVDEVLRRAAEASVE